MGVGLVCGTQNQKKDRQTQTHINKKSKVIKKKNIGNRERSVMRRIEILRV